MSDLIPSLQADDLKGLLDSDSYFANIPVIVEDIGDAVTEVEAATGIGTPKEGQTTFGTCVLIRQPSSPGKDRYPGMQHGPMDLEWTIIALENRLINKDTVNGGTGKRALTIARRIARLWKPYKAGGLTTVFSGITITPANVPIVNEASGQEEFLIGYAVRALGVEGDLTTYNRCAPVIISPTSGAAPQTVTLTCATSGASIYYTFDANLSHPWSGNDAATLYTTPISITTAGTLRARAFKTDYLAGDVSAVRYT